MCESMCARRYVFAQSGTPHDRRAYVKERQSDERKKDGSREGERERR